MILHSDSLHELKNITDNSIDTVITDPPYGYSFMGKDWDKAVPSVEIWRECLRVLKPGAFCLVMSAPRSDVQQAMTERLINAGFRLDFTPIYWTYASGFPKAGNIGKMVDKRMGVEREVLGMKKNGMSASAMKPDKGWNANNMVPDLKITKATSDAAKALDGSYAGFQPKPAVEVVIVAMKPLSEKTFVDQALKNGKGISWLDDGRIPTSGDVQKGGSVSKGYHVDIQPGTPHDFGRFPANLLVSDDVLNDGNYTSGTFHKRSPNGSNGSKTYGQLNRIIDKDIMGGYTDSGSYSRYFDLDKWYESALEKFPTFPFLIVPKAAKSEKNKGLDALEDRQAAGLPMRSANGERGGMGGDGSKTDRLTTMKNHHPTVKPLKLMSYLITLFTREGDTVLDPFVGSGTTVLAAEQMGRKGIGIEREEEYVEIARARLEHEFSTMKQTSFL